jgi:hypothetical protein
MNGTDVMIYAIRHGQTDLNKERRIQGRSGIRLVHLEKITVFKQEIKKKSRIDILIKDGGIRL